MAKQERQKKSTVANQVKAAADLSKSVCAPIEMTEYQLAVFDGIVASRERETWSDHDLRQAAKLAKLEVQFETEWDRLLEEGVVITNERGTEIENPRNRVCMTMQNTIKSLGSALGLTASQRGIAAGKQQKRNEQEINASRSAEKASSGLLA